MAIVKVDVNEIHLENKDQIIIKVALWDKDANDGEGGFNFVKLSIRRVADLHLHVTFEDGLSEKLLTNDMFRKLIFIH